MGIFRLAEIEMRGPPRRIQRMRTKGWRMPPDTIAVTQPGPYGNPYFPGCGLGFGNVDPETMQLANWPLRSAEDAVRHFREHLRLMERDDPRFEDFIAPLRGMNLACWCKLGAACHADVLLEYARLPMREAA